MKAQFFFYLSLILGIGFYLPSGAQTKLCYCEVGEYPSGQQKFFKVGCDIWLSEQKNCDVKEKVPQNFDYTQLAEFSSAKTEDQAPLLVVGFVGHFSGSREMISYLNQSIVPILKTGASVEVDNTACLSMKNPDFVLQYVKSLELPKNQTLKVTGNQATSIGKWDVVLGRSKNVPAVATSQSTEVIYPSCKRNQGMNCIQQIKFNG
ncbi:MAG: hypothetical protein ACOYOK_10355 [Pseudobdellovibrionaceae bacterium]